MSGTIRVICTQSLWRIGVADLPKASQAADFATWAENQGLSEKVGKSAARLYKFEGAPGGLTRASLFYGPMDHLVEIDRLTDAPALRALRTLHDEFSAHDDIGAQRIKDVLSRGLELIRFELNDPAWRGMGRPICWQTAMWLAIQGGGLVDANGEWWDPEGYDVIWSSL